MHVQREASVCFTDHAPTPLWRVTVRLLKPAMPCRKGGAERADRAFAALEAKYCSKPKKRKQANSDAEPSEEQFAKIQQQVESRRRKGKE